MHSFLALLFGAVFGVGLAVSGMTNPAKVTGFLDPFGDWDPTLAVVMGSAVLASSGGFALTRQMERPWAEARFHFPTRSEIDARLILGAILFGIGWGLVGLCPGPAIANLARGSYEANVFFGAMMIGTILHHLQGQRIPDARPVS